MYKKAIFRMFFTVLMIVTTVTVKAQVTIGSDLTPEKAALLDIKTKVGANGGVTTTQGGLLLPRVILNAEDNLPFDGMSNSSSEKLNHRGLLVYNIGGSSALDEGIYVWDGKKWQTPGFYARSAFFYMPSIELNAKTTGQKTHNLHTSFLEQFSNPKAKSQDNAPDLAYDTNPQNYYYYITGYDNSVFSSVSVNEYGILTYTVSTPPTDNFAYMNIIMVPK